MGEDGRPTVLVVDDEQPIRAAMTRALRDRCRVLLAEGLDEALVHLRKEAVDIVLADYMMPGGNGEELLTLVSRDWPHVRRALVSGTPPDHLPTLISSGLVELFVAKPWTLDELRAAVTTLSVAR